MIKALVQNDEFEFCSGRNKRFMIVYKIQKMNIQAVKPHTFL